MVVISLEVPLIFPAVVRWVRMVACGSAAAIPARRVSGTTRKRAERNGAGVITGGYVV